MARKIQLSYAGYTTLTTSLVACPSCSAPAGTLCMGGKGKRWNSGWHVDRGTVLHDKRKRDPEFEKRYQELREQLLRSEQGK